MDFEFRHLNTEEIALGESPIWDDTRHVVWFVDILAPALHSYDPQDGRMASFAMPCEVTCVALTQGPQLVLGLKSGVHLFDPETQQLELLVHPEPDRPGTRLNDGRVGPDGCLWIGSMHDSMPRQPTGSLYRVTPSGKFQTIRDGICVSNGLAWSADGRRMYHADTRRTPDDGVILAYDFDPRTGRASGERIFARLSPADGLPDGAAVDEEGCYWSAGITAGRLNRFAPDGALLQTIPLPTGAPTMPCFGGAGLDTLYVTALTREQNGQMNHGAFIGTAAALPFRGIPEWRFGTGAA